MAEDMLKVAYSTFDLSAEVWNHEKAPELPLFSDYSGGRLQPLLVEQWTGINGLRIAAKNVIQACKSSLEHEEAYQAQMAAAQKEVNLNCGPVAMEVAVAAGFTLEPGFIQVGSWSGAPFAAQVVKCAEAKIALGLTQATADVALWESIGALGNYASGVNDRAAMLGQSAAMFNVEAESANQAKAKADLEE